jgi:23S rRNA (adenine2030-N6)-methyltransferase
VGVLLLWYPLVDDRHEGMARALGASFPEGLRHEVRFAPVRAGHGLSGSGLFVVNPPWGLDGRLAWLSARFASL